MNIELLPQIRVVQYQEVIYLGYLEYQIRDLRQYDERLLEVEWILIQIDAKEYLRYPLYAFVIICMFEKIRLVLGETPAVD